MKSTKGATRRRRARYLINALVLIAPAWFFHDSLTPEFPAEWAEQRLGPYTAAPMPVDEAPPYLHDGAYVKDFAFRLCTGCTDTIRIARATVGPMPPASLDEPGGVVHGLGPLQEAHVPYPRMPGPQDRLWLTIQGWDGSLYHASWALPDTVR